MNSQSSKLLAISLVAVLGLALFMTGGSSGHGQGFLAGVADVSVASAAGAASSKSVNVAGDKAWEVVGGPVKEGTTTAGAEATIANTAASAPMNRLPW